MRKNQMITFQEFIKEGINDPSIFNAFFTAGGPGSGKSFVAQAIGVGGKATNTSGIKVLNSDPVFERLLDQAGLDKGKWEDIYSDEGQRIRDIAKAQTAKRSENYIKERLGLLVDGTGKKASIIIKQAKKLEKLGYKTYMLFVNTSLEVAQERNLARDRQLEPADIEVMWKKVQSNKPRFERFFGGNLYTINNDKTSDDVFTDLFVEIAKHTRTPVRNPEVDAWMEHEMKLRGITKRPTTKAGGSYGAQRSRQLNLPLYQKKKSRRR